MILKSLVVVTPEYAASIVRYCRNRLQPATIYYGGVERESKEIRTGSVAKVDWDDTKELKAAETILNIVAAAPGEKLQSPQVLCYKRGEFFKHHRDGRGRRRTVVVPLTVDYSGGRLNFPEHRLTYAPSVPGCGIIFSGDPVHESTPVEYGEKWSLVTWVVEA